jgi:Flp pilus assembly protein TadD
VNDAGDGWAALALDARGSMTWLVRARTSLVAVFTATLILACVDRTTEHRVRANAFFRGGQYTEALKECDLGLAAKPDDVGTRVLRAKSLFELDRFAEAKADYARAVRLGEARRGTYVGDAYLGLAILASRAKDWPEAEREFDKLLVLDEADVGTHTNLARVCLELGDLAKAEEHAKAAVTLRDQDEAALFMLGKVMLREGKLDEATATFARIAAGSPKASSAPYGMAMVLARRGDSAAALAKLHEATTLGVPNPREIADDPAFASMKDDPAFSRIVTLAAK